MKKIRDFLPEESLGELNSLLEKEYQKCRGEVDKFRCLDSGYSEKMDCHSGGVRRAIILINNFLNTEVAAEQEEIRPCREYVSEYEHYYSCGNCEDSVETEYIFCPNCGQKIKW